MSDINLIVGRIKAYTRNQRLVDLIAYLLFTLSLTVISVTVALALLKSPLYGLIGIIPIFFYRPLSFVQRVRIIEKKLGFNGELINSIQLSAIPKDNKEKYSQQLINAYIDNTAKRINKIDFSKYVSYKPLHNVTRFLLISIIVALIHPAIFPEHFWYSLYNKIEYHVRPGSGEYLQGAEIELTLQLTGVYLPHQVDLHISEDNRIIREKTTIHDGVAKKKIKLNEMITYKFIFLDHKTEEFRLTTSEPLFIETLTFNLSYPHYTKLKDEIKTGRQLIAPSGTQISMQGRASQSLKSAQFLLGDTLDLEHSGKEFSGQFTINESGTAVLYLKSSTELKEQVIIYAIPDLAPLVDIFYPGYNINLPQDMRLDIGIRCSDDYGLKKGIFRHKFKEENMRVLTLDKGAIEDTIYFEWDLSSLNMLPGDEVSYFVEVTDNAGNKTLSKTYYIYFPTMEEIYEEITKKEQTIEKGLEDLQLEHVDKIDEIARIQQKLMKERKLLWADQQKLMDVISKEKEILDRIDEWQAELESTVEKLKEGIILDQKSLERLREITKILQQIAPDELKKALENLQLTLQKNPQDLQKALEDLKKSQEDIARALERTLEILKRYQQEEKLKELAQMAKELASKADEIDKMLKENQGFGCDKEIEELNKEINKLAEELDELAASESLEQEIKNALKELAARAGKISETSSTSPGDAGQELSLMAADLERLYESLTQGRVMALRKNLLEAVNQLIDISKTQETLFINDEQGDIEKQVDIITATKTIAESLYSQQTKSLYVTPHTGKNLARAIKHMEYAKQVNQNNKYRAINARKAMTLLNVVCLDMLRSLEQAAAGGSSTGMDKFLEELSNISKGQMSLNQSSAGLLPLQVGGLTPDQRAQLKRLAGRQRALRQALESLRSEAGASKYQELLDNIINEMEKAEEALYQYKLDRELIERQKKIISRLLDTQKSIRKEDYEKKRKSKPGQDLIARDDPQSLPEELGKDQLRELIQKALKESYPEEYELYIREYFKRLLEER